MTEHPLYVGVKDKHGREIKVSDVIRDGNGTIGTVVKNMHPWGFERLQYAGLSIVHTAGEDWYEIIESREVAGGTQDHGRDRPAGV